MSRKKEKRLSIAIFLAITSIIIICVISIFRLQKVNTISSQIKYTKDVLLQLNDVYNTVITHAGAARNYSLEGKQEDVSAMQFSAALLQSKFNDLRSQVRGKAVEQGLTDSLEKYILKRIEHSDRIIEVGREQGSVAAAALYQTGTGRDYNNLIFSFINKMQANELEQLQVNEQKNAAVNRQLYYSLAGLTGFILVLLIFIIQKIRMESANSIRTETQLKQFNERLAEQVTFKTEQLEASEKNLRQVLSDTAENFYVVDKNYRVTIINEVARRNLEIAWGKPVSIGSYIPDVAPSDGEEPIRKSFEKAFAGEKTEYELPLAIPGLPQWVHVSFIPVYNEDNQVSGACVMTKDISSRKKAEEEKKQVNSLLNERVKELSTLHQVSQLLQAENQSSDILLKKIAGILPSGWQHADIAAAKITWKGTVFTSPNYKETPYRQKASFHSFDNSEGSIEVVYLEKRPQKAEGPFVAEERNMLNIIAEMLQTYFNRKHAEEKLTQSFKEIRLLASYIEKAREDEKIRISREIHDDLGQQLTGLKMDLSWLGKKIDPVAENLQLKINEMMQLLDEAVQSVRRIASELRPGILDSFGLVAAIEWQSSEFEKRSGIATTFHSDQKNLEVPGSISTGLFRIYQESLTNVARHAHASTVTSALSVAGQELILTIKDNGVGFDVSSTGQKLTLGLLGMKERTVLMGGKYVIDSKRGQGTSVMISVPLPKNDKT